jgi:ATP-dependent RNA helicase
MAEGGIDRKADERMEFTTSKDVTVAPTQVPPFSIS